jgi:glycosyltransferase involved in cell wall biosynthesis
MNIGFVATRIAGLDGVSLEINKWAEVLRRMGHTPYFCAGELGEYAQPGMLVPEFHFRDPEALAIHDEAFSGFDESRDLYRRIARAAAPLKDSLYQFVDRYRLDWIITQNAQTIPMQIPLGVALRDFIAETHVSTIAHHHDFYWERERFMVNRIPDILMTAFPAEGTSLRHGVINSAMKRELYIRRRLQATYIPNVFDFRDPPPLPDDYALTLRQAFQIAPDERLVVQPTRIIRRKNIERAVELVRQLGERDTQHRYTLVVTGYAGDESGTYYDWLMRQVAAAGIRVLFIGDRIVEHRATVGSQRLYTLWDIYPHADIVSYLSSYEGFGNALVETLYFRKPLIVNAFIAYRSDIKPAGVQAIEIHEDVTPDTVEAVLDLLAHPAEIERMAEHNYQVGQEHFSYEVLEQSLRTLVS